MRRLLFKVFGETKILFWIWGVSVALYLSAVVFITYVSCHFIFKNW